MSSLQRLLRVSSSSLSRRVFIARASSFCSTRRLFSTTTSSPQDPTPAQSQKVEPAQESQETQQQQSKSSENVRTQILDKALSLVPVHGWSQAALTEAARELNLSPAAHGLFPLGPVEIAYHLMNNLNKQMMQQLQSMNLYEMKTAERIKAALTIRLQLLTPYLKQWPQAMALGLSTPWATAATINNIALMIDDIWALAGDRTTDLSWYSKRMLLAGVYVSSELYMLTDRSVNYQDTMLFVDRRLQEIQEISKIPASIEAQSKQVLSQAVNLVSNYLLGNK